MEIMGALNGILHTAHTAHLVWADLADRIGEGHPLTQKIRSLSPAGRFALVDVAERFWQGDREVLKEIARG
jgi:hypothetical protein